MARTKGAVNKKKGLDIIIGIGVPKKGRGMNAKTAPNMPKMPKAKGKTTTQGAKPMSKRPNSMRKNKTGM